MADTGAHPGVRSLLARFENNQNNAPSPPSRGRSPVGSESSAASRQLSKVRASFVAVDGATQSGAVAGLRSTSSRSDSPAGPPSRVRSFNSDDQNAPLKSPLASPIGNGIGAHQAFERISNESKPAPMVETPIAQVAPPDKGAEPLPKETTPSHTKEDEPAPKASATLSPTKPATKRPSAIHVDKTNKPVPKSTSSPGLKSPAHPRTPTSPVKPDTSKATRPARSPRPPASKEAMKPPASKPTRAPPTTTARPAARPTRSSMPARDLSKPTTSTAARTSKPEPKPTTRPARTPASTAASTTASTARGTAGTTTRGSSVTRKPSTLKTSTRRAVTPTASSVRKQTSAPSLQRQPAHERPQSRVSNTSSKAVDEGFLARMMRPTASSASKAHEKVDVKSPPRSTRTARPPTRPTSSKSDTHKTRPTMEKTVVEKPQEKPQAAPADKNEVQEKTEPEAAEITAIPEQETAVEPQAADVPQPATETSVEAPSETPDAEEPVQVEESPVGQTVDASASAEESITPAAEPTSTIPPTAAEETAVEAPAATDNVDADIGKLSLN
ncbi:hypothetical protein BDV25DRAFT_110328 [Aspergillus avenaceus]|uniref:Mucin-7 n=1 Tax=Aspergillus avenaceus TaxID=36643 RepID=A0A5N6TVV7_ASPAV|nr:hypothetical protein BDV25DRAFT_110328 [Aspergillus avenaceus]